MTPEEIAALTPQQIADLVAANGKYKSDLDEATQLLTEQSTKIDELSASNPKAKLTVVVGGSTYTVIHGLKLNDVTYTPKMISENPDVAAKLIASNSSSLKLVPAKAAAAVS